MNYFGGIEGSGLPFFPKVPKAIAIDLDGTLLDSQTRLSPRSRLALENCLELGIPVIIATSRPARIFKRIFPEDLAEDRITAIYSRRQKGENKPCGLLLSDL